MSPARLGAGLLSVVGAALGMLWAAYVLHGLWTDSGPVEEWVQELADGPSVELDALVASLGAAVSWLLDTPRRRLARGARAR